MKKNKKSKEKTRNIVRITLILILSFFVSLILCHKEAKANNKILDQTVSDAFVFQSILLARSLEPSAPGEYTDISSLEDSSDSESFVSDAAIKTGASEYYIRVNYGANCVTIFTKDDEGNYTKPYKAMICSSGKSTPKSGTYKITYKYRWLSLYGGVYGQYSTRIVKNILFHSVPYYKQRADSLEYEEYDKLGTTASAGCIRLTVRDAKWIYDNIPSGTYVEFYSDPNNPGPLGKPKSQKISGDIDNRNWDPTDPDKNNPWTGGNGIPSVTYTTETKKSTKTTYTSDEDNVVSESSTKSSTDSSSSQSEYTTKVEVVEQTPIPTPTPTQETQNNTSTENASTTDNTSNNTTASSDNDTDNTHSSEASNSDSKDEKVNDTSNTQPTSGASENTTPEQPTSNTTEDSSSSLTETSSLSVESDL